MGPHSFERGDCDAAAWFMGRSLASMGPHSFERGDKVLEQGATALEALQWGRTLSSAEIYWCPCVHAKTNCFNGAALFRARR